MPGPPPKLPEERRRANKDVVEMTTVDISELVSRPIEIPAADPGWHEIALGWYESLQGSAVATLYEPTDWWTAYLAAEQLDRLLKPQFVGFEEHGEGVTEAKFVRTHIKGSEMSALLRVMNELMTTEATRRRLRIQVKREQAQAELIGNVTSITKNRREAMS